MCGKGGEAKEEDEGGHRNPGAREREMLQGKQNVGGRAAVLARHEWECQLFALVSNDRTRHCLCHGAKEAGYWGAALVRAL